MKPSYDELVAFLSNTAAALDTAAHLTDGTERALFVRDALATRSMVARAKGEPDPFAGWLDEKRRTDAFAEFERSLEEEAGRNLAAMDRAAELPRIGAHVRLARPVDRFPFFRCEEGERGMVVEVGPDVYTVQMDDPPEGSEEWAVVIHWTDRAEFLADIEPASLHDSADDHERRYLR